MARDAAIGDAVRRLSPVRARLWWERAFWVRPLAGVGAGVLLHQAFSSLDEWVATVANGLISVQAAGQLLAAIGGGMVTFTGFVFSFVVLILQFGSSQYSPRTVSYFLRTRSTQWILGLFLLTITFCFLGLLEIGSLGRDVFAPQASAVASVVLLLASLVGFIVLLSSVGRRVRVDAVLSDLGRQARRQFPRRLIAPVGAAEFTGEGEDIEAEAVRHAGSTGQVVGVDVRRLVRIARRHSCTVRVRVRVGDSVSHGTTLIEVDGPRGLFIRGALARCIVVDVERSLRYDPMYILRLIVDIALRALSPGTNDPTTAVRALDEIEDVLRVASELPLGPRTLEAGDGCVIVPWPTWQDVVSLALHEIIVFGSGQPQVTRRLFALLDAVENDAPPQRAETVARARATLTELVDSAAPNGDLRAIARTPDRQGLGG